jgi:hypothetical protein
MAMVTINGASVDADDPCALYQALYAVKLRMLSGEQVGEMSIQSPVTREAVVFSPGRLADLDRELVRLSEACTLKTTGRRVTRRWKFRY